MALTDLPPLGIVRLAAVAVGDDEMKTTGDVGGYAKAPRRDPAVTFESDGTAAVGGVKMSVASVASPADERFGDGPYVSRSGLWHVLPVVCGALVCFVNVTFAAWVAASSLRSSKFDASAASGAPSGGTAPFAGLPVAPSTATIVVAQEFTRTSTPASSTWTASVRTSSDADPVRVT